MLGCLWFPVWPLRANMSPSSHASSWVVLCPGPVIRQFSYIHPCCLLQGQQFSECSLHCILLCCPLTWKPLPPSPPAHNSTSSTTECSRGLPSHYSLETLLAVIWSDYRDPFIVSYLPKITVLQANLTLPLAPLSFIQWTPFSLSPGLKTYTTCSQISVSKRNSHHPLSGHEFFS